MVLGIVLLAFLTMVLSLGLLKPLQGLTETRQANLKDIAQSVAENLAPQS